MLFIYIKLRENKEKEGERKKGKLISCIVCKTRGQREIDWVILVIGIK